MIAPSRLLPDPELEELGERVNRALESYAKRLRPSDLQALIDAPIRSVLHGLRVNIAADSAGIWIVDESRENLVFSIITPEDNTVVGLKQTLSEGFISLVFASEQPISANRVAEDERHSKHVDLALGRSTEAIVAVPFYLGGVLSGVLSAVRWEGEGEGAQDGAGDPGDAFSSEALRTLQRASVVIERLVTLSLAKTILGLEL
jgi:hypothetical protein